MGGCRVDIQIGKWYRFRTTALVPPTSTAIGECVEISRPDHLTGLRLVTLRGKGPHCGGYEVCESYVLREIDPEDTLRQAMLELGRFEQGVLF